jgi:hypothetical protein
VNHGLDGLRRRVLVITGACLFSIEDKVEL